MLNQLFDYEIPFLHPLAVHFPLALLVIASFSALAWAVTRSSKWQHTTHVLLFFGALGAVAAFLTGDALEEDSEGVPIVDQFVELHENLGRATMILALVSFAALSLYAWLSKSSTSEPLERQQVWMRWAIACLVIVSAVLVALTGHIGGTMVWGVPAS